MFGFISEFSENFGIYFQSTNVIGSLLKLKDFDYTVNLEIVLSLMKVSGVLAKLRGNLFLLVKRVEARLLFAARM